MKEISGHATRSELADFFYNLLHPNEYQDYGPNGLQVEGQEHLDRIAFSVSATLESIREAIRLRANALVVHHGLLWNFHGVRPLCGPFGQRIRLLMQNNINLYAYHLPLDGHQEVGNAACLAKALKMKGLMPFGDHKGQTIGIQGTLQTPHTADELKALLQDLLNHPVLVSSDDANRPIHTMGIITGGANSKWQDAAQAGLDAYLTGEMSEHDWHDAREAGVHMFAGGHHATEVFGIQRLMQEVQERFPLACFFVNSNNPA